MHAAGYAAIAALGERFSLAEGLDARQWDMVRHWQAIHEEQTQLAKAVRVLPGEVEAWRARRVHDLPLDAHGGADPADPACRAWRTDGERLKVGARAML